MIQIDRHIEVLLLDNDCVIVPDLGGFMAYHVPARYVNETGQFIPPSRQLGFNAQLKINDSLLAQSYIEAYDISYPEALRRIEAEVEEMNQMIHNTGICELNDIGVLRVNEQGNIEFEPCEAGILTPSLYGLNTLDMMPLSHKVEVKKKPVINIAKPEPKGDKKNEIADTPIVPAPFNIVAKHDNDVAEEEADDEQKHSFISLESVKKVVAVAAVVISLFIIAVPFGSPTQEAMNRSYLDSGFLYNLFAEKPSTAKVTTPKQEVKPTVPKVETKEAQSLPKPSATPETANATKANEKPIEHKAVEPNKVEPKAADVKQAANNSATAKNEAKQSGPHYSIVLASCIPHKNAVEVAQKLSQSGLNATRVVDRTNGSKVVYGQYASEKEAQDALRSLRSKDNNFEKGWIMKF